MIRVYTVSESGLKKTVLVTGDVIPPGAAWIDMLEPTPEEERAVESALNIEAPSPEEMQEIEISSRLRQQDNALYMTITVLSRADSHHAESTEVTFILVGRRLVTLRYVDIQPFRVFAVKVERQPDFCKTGDVALNALLEAIIDRTADILGRAGNEVDVLSQEIFDRDRNTDESVNLNLQEIMRRIGHNGALTSKVRESLVSISRLLSFLLGAGEVGEFHSRTKVITRDVQSLSDHATFLSSKVSFLLDATLGMINIEQNNIIKIFSVAAVVFLPPTLIASIYGMNFKFMPELGWMIGYPLAVVMMVASAVLPYMYFKRRGWL
jgi:magnesium transporter